MANKEQQYEYERQRIEAMIRTAKLSGIDVKFQLPQRPHEITVQHVKQLQSVTPEQVLGLKPHEVATPQGPKVTDGKGEGVPKTAKQKTPQTRKAREFHSATPRQEQGNGVTPPPRSYYVYGQLQDTLQTFGGPAAHRLEEIWARAIAKYGVDEVEAGLDNALRQDGALYDAIVNLAHYKDFGDNAQSGRGFAAFAELLNLVATQSKAITAEELAADAKYQEIWAGLEPYAEPE